MKDPCDPIVLISTPDCYRLCFLNYRRKMSPLKLWIKIVSPAEGFIWRSGIPWGAEVSQTISQLTEHLPEWWEPLLTGV